MCPACLAAMAPAIAGAASGTGVLALAVRKLRGRRRKGEPAMEQAVTTSPRVVSREDWLRARKALLHREKQLTRERDELARLRRELPWVKVEKDYVFDAPGGRVSLAELFAGKGQLIVYHFMFGPDWPQGCPSCSLLADHFDGMNQHLPHRDVRLVAVSRAPLAKILDFKQRMGWQIRLGVLVRQRVQPRLRRLVLEGGGGGRRDRLQLRHGALARQRGAAWHQRVPQGRGRRRLPHLLRLRPRARSLARHLQLPRPHAEGPRRGRPAVADGVGAAPRPVRFERAVETEKQSRTAGEG